MKLFENNKEIWKFSAIEISKFIRSGQISCLDTCKAFIDRIKMIDKKTNALAYNCFDDAIKLAEKYDIRYQKLKVEKKLDILPIYYGVPVVLKESIELKNKPFTFGSLKNKYKVGKNTCLSCKRLISNGMIILGAGNLSEGCFWIESINPIYGQTNNPYNLNKTSGGSSGGTAVLVAISGSPIGIGSDSGGSLRLPSHYNGIFTHKPSGGLIPSFTNNCSNNSDEGNHFFSQIGPITKFSHDLAPTFTILTNPNIQNNIPKFDNLSLHQIEFINILPGFNLKLNLEIEEIYNKFFSKLKNYECKIKTENIKQLNASFYIWSSYMKNDNSMQDYLSDLKQDLKIVVSNFLIGNSNIYSLGFNLLQNINSDFKINLNNLNHDNFKNLKNEIKIELINLLSLNSNSVLILPTFTHPAPDHNTSYKYILNMGLLGIWNILGFPVTQIPIGMTKDNLPVGIQIIALPNNDYLSMKVAELLEENELIKFNPPTI